MHTLLDKHKVDRLHPKASALQAKDWKHGYNGLDHAAINYHNLHGYWATVAMRLSCALKTETKRLHLYFEPGELVSLAELLKQKTDLRGLLVYGMSCLHMLICAYCIHKGGKRFPNSTGCPSWHMQ